jgi:hypothetical protein
LPAELPDSGEILEKPSTGPRSVHLDTEIWEAQPEDSGREHPHQAILGLVPGHMQSLQGPILSAIDGEDEVDRLELQLFAASDDEAQDMAACDSDGLSGVQLAVRYVLMPDPRIGDVLTLSINDQEQMALEKTLFERFGTEPVMTMIATGDEVKEKIKVMVRAYYDTSENARNRGSTHKEGLHIFSDRPVLQERVEAMRQLRGRIFHEDETFLSPSPKNYFTGVAEERAAYWESKAWIEPLQNLGLKEADKDVQLGASEQEPQEEDVPFAVGHLSELARRLVMEKIDIRPIEERLLAEDDKLLNRLQARGVLAKTAPRPIESSQVKVLERTWELDGLEIRNLVDLLNGRNPGDADKEQAYLELIRKMASLVHAEHETTKRGQILRVPKDDTRVTRYREKMRPSDVGVFNLAPQQGPYRTIFPVFEKMLNQVGIDVRSLRERIDVLGEDVWARASRQGVLDADAAQTFEVVPLHYLEPLRTAPWSLGDDKIEILCSFLNGQVPNPVDLLENLLVELFVRYQELVGAPAFVVLDLHQAASMDEESRRLMERVKEQPRAQSQPLIVTAVPYPGENKAVGMNVLEHQLETALQMPGWKMDRLKAIEKWSTIIGQQQNHREALEVLQRVMRREQVLSVLRKIEGAGEPHVLQRGQGDVAELLPLVRNSSDSRAKTIKERLTALRDASEQITLTADDISYLRGVATRSLTGDLLGIAKGLVDTRSQLDEAVDDEEREQKLLKLRTSDRFFLVALLPGLVEQGRMAAADTDPASAKYAVELGKEVISLLKLGIGDKGFSKEEAAMVRELAKLNDSLLMMFCDYYAAHGREESSEDVWARIYEALKDYYKLQGAHLLARIEYEEQDIWEVALNLGRRIWPWAQAVEPKLVMGCSWERFEKEMDDIEADEDTCLELDLSEKCSLGASPAAIYALAQRSHWKGEESYHLVVYLAQKLYFGESNVPYGVEFRNKVTSDTAMRRSRLTEAAPGTLTGFAPVVYEDDDRLCLEVVRLGMQAAHQILKGLYAKKKAHTSNKEPIPEELREEIEEAERNYKEMAGKYRLLEGLAGSTQSRRRRFNGASTMGMVALEIDGDPDKASPYFERAEATLIDEDGDPLPGKVVDYRRALHMRGEVWRSLAEGFWTEIEREGAEEPSAEIVMKTCSRVATSLAIEQDILRREGRDMENATEYKMTYFEGLVMATALLTRFGDKVQWREMPPVRMGNREIPVDQVLPADYEDLLLAASRDGITAMREQCKASPRLMVYVPMFANYARSFAERAPESEALQSVARHWIEFDEEINGGAEE